MPTKEEELLERLRVIGKAAMEADNAWKDWESRNHHQYPPKEYLDAVGTLIQKAIHHEEPPPEDASKKLLKTILSLSGIEATDLEKGFKVNVEIKFPPEKI